jgi:hypothetical protein
MADPICIGGRIDLTKHKGVLIKVIQAKTKSYYRREILESKNRFKISVKKTFLQEVQI